MLLPSVALFSVLQIQQRHTAHTIVTCWTCKRKHINLFRLRLSRRHQVAVCAVTSVQRSTCALESSRRFDRSFSHCFGQRNCGCALMGAIETTSDETGRTKWLSIEFRSLLLHEIIRTNRADNVFPLPLVRCRLLLRSETMSDSIIVWAHFKHALRPRETSIAFDMTLCKYSFRLWRSCESIESKPDAKYFEWFLTFSTFVNVICRWQVFDALARFLLRVANGSREAALLCWFAFVAKFFLAATRVIWNEFNYTQRRWELSYTKKKMMWEKTSKVANTKSDKKDGKLKWLSNARIHHDDFIVRLEWFSFFLSFFLLSFIFSRNAI